MLESVEELENLEALVAHYCPFVTDEVLSAWARLDKLKLLGCAWCHLVTDVGVEHAARLTNLVYLDITGCDKITHASLQMVRGLQFLRFLGVRHTRIAKEGFHFTNGSDPVCVELCTDVLGVHLELLSHEGLVDSWLRGI